MTSVGSSVQESRIHCKMVLPGGAFKFPAAVSSWFPTVSSHSSYFSLQVPLNSLFQQTSGAWIYLVHPPGTITRLIFLDCNAWVMLSSMWHLKESQANSLRLKENKPKTESIQTFVSPMSTHAFAEVATTARCLNSWFKAATSRLAPMYTTIGFSLVPSVLAAKHTDTFFLAHENCSLLLATPYETCRRSVPYRSLGVVYI